MPDAERFSTYTYDSSTYTYDSVQTLGSTAVSRIACTIATRSHLALALCMAASYLNHHPNGLVYILLVDHEKLPDSVTDHRIVALRIRDLDLDALAAMQARYTTFELCNALKPTLLLHLLNIVDEDRVVYLDSDLYFFASLESEVFRVLDECALVLTPHLATVPLPDAEFVHRDLAILQGGTLNGGFVGVRRCVESERLLRWWESRLETAGYHQLERGMNCDQRWLDLLSAFDAGVRICRHPGLNVAYWNLAERTISLSDGRHISNGVPLVFVHFSGFRPDDNHAITKNWTRFTLENRPDLRRVADEYREALRAATALVAGPANAPVPSSSGIGCDFVVPAHGMTPNPSHDRADVTIVIPVYNSAATLARAVNSALRQTDVEVAVVVVDDGSTDHPESQLPEDPRVRFIRQVNAGVSAARNAGLQTVRSPFVVFLDADDEITDHRRVRDQISLFEIDSTIALVHSGWCVVDAETGSRVERTPWTQMKELTLEALVEWPVVLPSAMTWRTKLVRDVGGFDGSLHHLEDVELTWRILAAGYNARWLPRVTTDYVRHANNASSNTNDQARAVETVLDSLFSRTDLPAPVASRQRAVRYGLHVWLASRFFAAGDFESMASHLTISSIWSNDAPEALPRDWLQRFEQTTADAGGSFDALPVLTRPEWVRIVRMSPLDLMAAGVAAQAKAKPPRPINTLIKTPPLGSRIWDVAPEATRSSKLDLRDALGRDYGVHRGGWSLALSDLTALHDDDGLFVDGFIEHTFFVPDPKPYDHPWVGFLHNPPGNPSWYRIDQSADRLAQSKEFIESLAQCKGLFTLSDTLRSWWVERIDVPVVAIAHPTARPAMNFSFEAFFHNPMPRVVQIGTWLRKLHSIYALPVSRLKPTILHQHKPYIADLFAAERKALGITVDSRHVDVLPFLDNDSYDELLRSNIVFLDLYAASANNAVVECMIRATPILVNPLPAVLEYLGNDYPLYYASRAEAARKAEDNGRIKAAHEYLRELPNSALLEGDRFVASIAATEIYKRLPPP